MQLQDYNIKFQGLIDIGPLIFFTLATISTTRGHNYKISKSHSQYLQDQTFSNCVTNDLNS